MSQIQSVSGRGVPLVGNDIDTDRIIPARFLRCVTFDGLGEQVFADDRTQAQGQHPFDLPQYKGATVLVVNRNFGCGSSREHAPQAIAKWGIRALVGESFAEIFFGNCVALGIPCVIALPEVVKQIQNAIAADPKIPLSIHLEPLVVQFGEQSAAVTLGESQRRMFLSGDWDTCGQLAAQAAAIQSTAVKLPYLQWGQVS